MKAGLRIKVLPANNKRMLHKSLNQSKPCLDINCIYSELVLKHAETFAFILHKYLSVQWLYIYIYIDIYIGNFEVNEAGFKWKPLH